MTRDQRNMLFTLFARLAKGCAATSVAERDRLRLEITEDLFGDYVSWSHFENTHVDRMKRRLMAMLNPNDVDAQMADSDEGGEAATRERLLHRIDADMRKAGFGDWYVRKIAVDLYDAADWRALPLDRLENLRNTIANRARRKAPSDPVPVRHC